MSQFIKESDLHTSQEEIKTENIVQNIPQSENTTVQNMEKKSKKGKIILIIIVTSLVSIAIFCLGVYWFLLKPSLEGYLTRSQDTSRQASLRSISLAISSFAIDKDKIPQEIPSGCIPVAELGASLMNIPTDPITGRLNDGCTDTNAESTFGYRVLENTEKSQKYILSATLETGNYGNSPYSIDELVKNPELLKEVESGKYNKKGKYYIVVN